jgi:hypothetical protein
MAKKAAKKKAGGKATAPAKKVKSKKAAGTKRVVRKAAKSAPVKAAAESLGTAPAQRMGMALVATGCPSDNCSLEKPAPGEIFDPMESVDIWVRETYADPIRVVGVWAKIVDSIPGGCAIPDGAISLMQDPGDAHLWKGFEMAPNGDGDYFVVAWVKIEKIDCKNNVGISVES